MNNVQIHTFSQPFVTESGFSIPEPTVAYQTWGRLNKTYDNAVLVCHALTGNTAADQWFGGLMGPGKLLDPEKHFIICPNVLGSCYGTTGPTSINPETGKPYQADFPDITIRDMARMHQRLLDELSIRSLELVIGGSMGGMQALELIIMDPRPAAAVLIGMGKAHRPWAIGISHTQRQAIYADPNWNGGYYPSEQPPTKGLALARMIAMNSYRNPVDFDEKFGRNLQPDSDLFQVESYLNYQGQKIVGRFDAVSYVRLTQAMDSHDVGRNRAAYAKILDAVQIPVMVTGIDTDWLYPVDEQKELASLLPFGSYTEIQSPYGHDAFLIEFDQINSLYRSFTKELIKSETI